MAARTFVIVCAVALLSAVAVSATPLDDYVNAPDPYYSWRLNSTFNGLLGYKVYVLELTSQMWLTKNQSSSPIWRHWLTVCVPDFPDLTHTHTGFMYMGGGHINDAPPTSLSDSAGLIVSEVVCVSSRTISTHLSGIPNEPLVFNGDGRPRSEDALIAYAWGEFLNHTDQPIWLPRLPMVKAAVKALDAVQEFVAKQNLGYTVQNFVVAGASKRGWTTWLHGVVDKRVIAMIPMVMPILNIVPNMNHHYQAYGGWSFALNDYLNEGLMAYLNKPQFLAMAAVNDPFSYRDRMTMPKLIITACGDEFFLPDSPQFFIRQLPGETFLDLIPNAEHSLSTGIIDVGESISTFYQLIISNTPRPQYTYALKKSNTTASITVSTFGGQKPKLVQKWAATTLSDKLRDFRLVICDKIPQCIQPVIWYYSSLEETSTDSQTWVATQDAPHPGYGWTGFLVELIYEYPELPFPDVERVLRVTTEVNIVPDVMPFPPCGNHCQTAVPPSEV
eukprot:TRINITY_DN2216_c0_g2_i1.p1 TRINITY_DN2216_c0_g2~~TRINITY_DN2216_c0_g2_i1.p1  ORF type:complete len:502 (-),score=51.58 TRINITY_DN2216_c0_g2_i1:46-1551(-)